MTIFLFTKYFHILVLVEIVFIILEEDDIIAVVTIELLVIKTAAVVVFFWGLYFGSNVYFNSSPVKLQVLFFVVTSELFTKETLIINV